MHAMPEGGTIRIEIASEHQKAVVITFQDNGEGIQEKHKEKIWDPFFTTKDKGTGLGLGIVKNIIELHNGSIRIDNKTDMGACVTIKLPASPDQRM
jgi:signal transduction histidine kinase